MGLPKNKSKQTNFKYPQNFRKVFRPYDSNNDECCMVVSDEECCTMEFYD